MNLIKCKKRLLKFIGSNLADGRYAFILSYLHNRKKFPNLKNPTDLSEILIRRVLDGKVDDIYYLADKYLVRNYVKSQKLEQFLPTLLGVYKEVEDIPFEQLPNKFALKMNFGVGMNIICTDKSKLDIDLVKSKLTSWLNLSPKYSYAERHYNLIERKIICEEFIEDGSGNFPADYKFMCIKGYPLSVLVCVNRGTENEIHYPFNLDWQPQSSYIRTKRKLILPKPKNFDKMIEVVRQLSKKLDFVRVDLYSDGERIWIGELTLTPAGCILHNWTQKALDDMGKFYRENNV